MSTFEGIVKEFPDIRIDYFRTSNEPSQPPLAYFLSHVHSDHLTGLESCKSPFIYCSPATREILLRLEKYPHRMNFAKGILETRKQTYRHLKSLLKPIPLETPTVLELAPGHSIRVTLFDANHCIGAVMLLIEGDGRAILYTGDIRSEAWWVDSLTRHPLLLQYASAGKEVPLKRLDNIYLDTTFASKEDKYKVFPSKQQGLIELLHKLSAYPQNTRFYFDSWTFGYEDVWQTLASTLDTQVHLDEYRFGLYRSLVNGVEPKAVEGAKLMGFHCGNHFQQGCLTSSVTRLHSCENGTGCEIWNQDFVRITPIISRHDGQEMSELGAGGGQGDLDQQHELEVGDAGLVGQLITLCASTIQHQPDVRARVLEMLSSIISGQVSSIALDSTAFIEHGLQAAASDVVDGDNLPLEKLVDALTRRVMKSKNTMDGQVVQSTASGSKQIDSGSGKIPKQITFPYSRHSSYGELCLLVEAFKPVDIYPCTVDKANWTPVSSMSYLFGHLYPGDRTFTHDQKMLKTKSVHTLPVSPPQYDDDQVNGGRTLKACTGSDPPLKRARPSSRVPQCDNWPPTSLDHYSPPKRRDHYSPRGQRKAGARPSSHRHSDADESYGRLYIPDVISTLAPSLRPTSAQSNDQAFVTAATCRVRSATEVLMPQHKNERSRDPDHQVHLHQKACREEASTGNDGPDDRHTASPQPTPLSSSQARLALRREAHDAALGLDDTMWSSVNLVSTDGHQVKEEEL